MSKDEAPYPWLQYIRLGRMGIAATWDEDLFWDAITVDAAAQRTTITHRNFEPDEKMWRSDGVGARARHLSALQGMLKDAGAHRLAVQGVSELWVWSSGCLSIRSYGSEKENSLFRMEAIFSVQDEWVLPLFDYLERVTEPQPEEEPEPGDFIHVFGASPRGDFEIQTLGFIKAPLIEENYTPDVVEGFHFTLHELRRPNPDGRITILDGPPGTGKTWLMRALIHHAVGTKILVPPEMIPSMTQPDFLVVLRDYQRQDDGPIVLILEDADQMLAERMAESMATITTALNMGDGILGQMLNIRLICSTNQPLEHIDPALKRPGRLSRRIEVSTLPETKARALFAAKTGLRPQDLDPSDATKKEWTLAEVYAAVKMAQRKKNEKLV